MEGLTPVWEGQDWPKPPGVPHSIRAMLMQHVMMKGMLPS